MDAGEDRRSHRRARALASGRPPSGGARRRPASCSTPAASSTTPTACRTRSARSTSSSRPAASASPRAATARSSARPTARAAASTGRSATSSPAGATSPTPSTASTSPASGASTKQDIPGPGVDAYELFRKIDAGEIKGLLSICFNPKVSLPDNSFVTRCLEKLEFYVAIDFFLNDTARHADIVLPGSLQEEDEGTVTQVEGRVIKINKAVDCPGEARQDWRIIQDIAARARAGRTASPSTSPREIFEELRVASKGGVADYSGITYEKIEQQLGVFWPCYSARSARPASRSRSSRHAAPLRAGQLQPGRERRRAVLLPRRQGALQRRRLPHARRRRRATSIRSS